MLHLLLLTGCLFDGEAYDAKLAELQEGPAPSPTPACPDGEQSYGRRDVDGDGYGAGDEVLLCPSQVPREDGLDCDDTDPGVFPGAPERCNAADDDCDGALDEDLPTSDHFVDLDGDGLGAGDPQRSCGPLGSLVADGTDCDDTDPAVHGPVQGFEDEDGDGYGVAAVTACPGPAISLLAGDCDDSDVAIHPGVALDLSGAPDADCDGDVLECDSYGFVAEGEDPAGLLFELESCPSIALRLQPSSIPYPPFDVLRQVDIECDGWTPGAEPGCVIEGQGRLMEMFEGGRLAGLRFEQSTPTSSSGGCVLLSDGGLVIEDVVLTSCEADQGGGIHVEPNAGPLTLDRVTILGGVGNEGGAIQLMEGVQLDATDLVVRDTSSSTGALHLRQGASATIIGATFEDNSSSLAGGAIYLSDAELGLANATLSGNSADTGAGIWADASDVTLDGVALLENTTFVGVGTADQYGGAVALMHASMLVGSDVTIQGHDFVDSSALYASESDVLLDGFLISQNTDEGVSAPLAVAGGELVLRNGRFEDNTNTGDGPSALFLHQGTAGSELTDVQATAQLGSDFVMVVEDSPGFEATRLHIFDNLSNGGIDVKRSSSTLSNLLITGNAGVLPGLGVLLDENDLVRVFNATIADNTGDSLRFRSDFSNTLQVRNSVLWGSSFGIFQVADGTPDAATVDLAYSIIGGENAPTEFVNDTVVMSESVTDLDPGLQPVSAPPYQGGVNTVDAGDPLILDPDGTVSDLGAYGGPEAFGQVPPP